MQAVRIHCRPPGVTHKQQGQKHTSVVIMSAATSDLMRPTTAWWSAPCAAANAPLSVSSPASTARSSAASSSGLAMLARPVRGRGCRSKGGLPGSAGKQAAAERRRSGGGGGGWALPWLQGLLLAPAANGDRPASQ